MGAVVVVMSGGGYVALPVSPPKQTFAKDIKRIQMLVFVCFFFVIYYS